jgi:hypothetical protein
MILTKVREFADFDAGNDPHSEHDFGPFDHGDETYFWKIDCHDLQCEYFSENPADPSITTRVLTVMRADEYWPRSAGVWHANAYVRDFDWIKLDDGADSGPGLDVAPVTVELDCAVITERCADTLASADADWSA